MFKIYSKYRLMILSACIFTTLIGYWLVFKESYFHTDVMPEDLNPNSPSLTLLFSFYDGVGSGIPIMLFFLIIPFISNFTTSILNIEKVNQQIALRKGWKGYLFQEVWRSVKQIWYLPILINGILILLIVCTVPLFPLYSEQYNPHFYSNLISDIVIFTSFQIIGWTLLNLLCLIFAELTLNKFLYPFLLLIVSLGITFLGTFLTNLTFGNEWIISALSPFNLFSPGVILLIWAPNKAARILTVFVSFGLYAGLIVALFWLILRRKRTNG